MVSMCCKNLNSLCWNVLHHLVSNWGTTFSVAVFLHVSHQLTNYQKQIFGTNQLWHFSNMASCLDQACQCRWCNWRDSKVPAADICHSSSSDDSLDHVRLSNFSFNWDCFRMACAPQSQTCPQTKRKQFRFGSHNVYSKIYLFIVPSDLVASVSTFVCFFMQT